MLQRVLRPHGIIVYESLLLSRVGVVHAFTTRHGGLSSSPFDTLNLDKPGSDPQVQRNLARLLEALDLHDHSPATLRQVHGCETHLIATPSRGCTHPRINTPADELRPVDDPRPLGDALVTGSDRPLLIRTADCVPILLCDASGQTVAAVHAGWRGLVAGVVRSAVTAMRSLTAQPLLAAVGPAIGVAHFEVGPEVAQAFRDAGLAHAVHTRIGPKPHVDLPRAAVELLQREEILESNIDMTDRCTFEHAEDFFSHRRDLGRTGRHAAIIRARPAPPDSN